MTVYKEAGVDIVSTDKLIKKIVSLSSKTNRPGKMGKIGSFGGMFDLKICNYKDAILLYPAIESILSSKLNNLTNLLMKDAYFATKDDELFLAVQSLRSIIQLNPELANELDPYIVKLESKMENQIKFNWNIKENKKNMK